MPSVHAPPKDVRSLVNEENPWPGPEAFDEAAAAFFNGRSDETAELRRLVLAAQFTVFFGASGLGKTSLIRAGLFPLIRTDQLLPIYIRLDVRQSAGSFSDQLKIALENEMAARGIDGPKFAPGEALWAYLHRENLELWSPQNQLLTPLFVFDQFEEVFTVGAENRDAVGRLRVQLADLVENRVPQQVAANGETLTLDTQRYKVLASFREDFLPGFEGWKREIPSMMRNRLRLLPMSGDQAFQAVHETAPYLVDAPVAQRIVQFVAAAQEEDAEDGRESSIQMGGFSVDPALLSIFCQGLNEKRKAQNKQRLDQALLNEAGNKIIEDFYHRAVDDQPERVQRFIANEFITARGFRNSCDVGDAQAVHHLTPEELRVLVDRRLLRIEPHGRSERIELTHDVLTRVVREQRERRRERESAKKRKRLAWLGLLLLILLTGLVAVFLTLFRRADQQARLATTKGLAMAALLTKDTQADLAAVLSVQAYRTADIFEARSALLSIVEASNRLIAYLHHADPVTSVAFSPDGKILASASTHRTVLWDVASRRTLGQPLGGPAGGVMSVAFSPDGKILASGSWTKTVLWDVASRQRLDQLMQGQDAAVRSVAFSPDGKILASASGDGTVRLWDVASRQSLGKPMQGHKGAVWSVAFSPDGKILATAGGDGTVRLWGVASRQPLGQPLQGHKGAVSVWSVAFSPDGKILASAGGDGTVRLWHVASRQPLGEPLQGHKGAVSSVAFSPGGNILAAGSWGKTVLLWNVASRQPVGQLQGYPDIVSSVAFSPDGKILAVGSGDKTVRLWDVASRQPLAQPLQGPEGGGVSVAFSPDGKILASASIVNTVRLWDLATRQPLGQPLRRHHGLVRSVAFSPDGSILASAGDDGVWMWDVAIRQPLGQLQGQKEAVWSLAFSPDDKTLASAGSSSIVRLWDVASRQPIGRLQGQWGTVAVAFSPDGKILATAGGDKTVRLWDVARRQRIGKQLQGHENDVTCVAFSPDGKILASGSWDKTMRLWDVASRQPLGNLLKGHEAPVRSVAFSPDGKVLASASDDGVRLWDVASRQPLGQALQRNEQIVRSVAFSPNGKILASGSSDNTVWLWDVNIESWITRLCGIANRNLSLAEWRQYVGPSIGYSKTCPTLPPGEGVKEQ